MKIFNKIAIISVVSCFLCACNKDFLNVVPKDQLTDETFWKTENDVDLALTGCYRGWDTYRNILWLDLATDNGYSQFPNDNAQVMGNGQMNAANVGMPFFNYTQIRKYNNFLEKVNGVSMDEEKKNRFKAEVRFLRAYDYFRKTQFYGDVPL